MRDLRNRELQVLIIATLCAVICLTSISFLISSVNQLLGNTSAALIGGDRVISSPIKIDKKIYEISKRDGLESTTTVNFYSMLTSDQDLALVAVKAVTTEYPLRGKLYINNKPTDKIPTPGTLWLEERAMLLLGVSIGSKVDMGDATFTVAEVLTLEPDRVGGGFSFAPRALMNEEDLVKAEVLQPGSRINYKLLIAGNDSALENFDKNINGRLSADQNIQIAGTTENNSAKRLNQATSYLSLAVLVNIILAAVVIGLVSQNYSKSHMRDVAIMRCMGASTRQIIIVYSLNLLIIALVCGLIGSICGYGLEQLLSTLLHRYLELEIGVPSWGPLFLGVGCAVLLVLGLALPAMIALGKVTPMHVLRKEHIARDKIVWMGYWLISSLFMILLYVQAGNVELFRLIVLSIIGASFASLVVIQILFKVIPKVIPQLPATLRISLTNIVANASSNSMQLLAFAVVISVALMLFVIRTDLLNTWRDTLPRDAPNYFVLNIPQDEVQDVKGYLRDESIEIPEFYPMVRGRLQTINGFDSGYWRPLNLTWTNILPSDNKIIQGKWITNDQVGISIEQKIAERIGVKLGDVLTFEVQLQEISAPITSIRSVEWGSFNPNFYVIYPPAMMKKFTGSYMASFYVPPNQKSSILTLVREFPAINVLGVQPILDQAVIIVDLVSVLIAYIWIFTLLVGLLLLLAIILTSIPMRNYQNNLMRVLGASRRQLQQVFVFELTLLGAIAGFLAATVAIIVGKYVAGQLFQISYAVDWHVLFVGSASGIILMLIGGFVGTYKALKTAPIQLLRNMH